MRVPLILSVLLFTFASVAQAQNPLVAARAPLLEAGAAYSYVNTDIPSQGRLGMNGIQAIANADFSRRFGIKLDIGYARSFNAFSTRRSADLLTYMAGPVFYPVRNRGYNIYAQFLAGGARETGVNFVTNGAIVTGFVNKFAWSGGAGFQYRLTPTLSVRVGADYLRTQFFTPAITVQKQNTLRSSVGVIYTFGGHRE
jgi:opacity protein-like surface antigen